MDRKEIVFLNDEIRTDFAKKNVYFSQFTEGVVKIQKNSFCSHSGLIAYEISFNYYHLREYLN